MNEEIKKEEQTVEETPVEEKTVEEQAIEPEVVENKENNNSNPKATCKFTLDAYMSLNQETSRNMFYFVIVLELIIIALGVLFFINKQYIYGGVVAGLAVLYPFFVYWLNVVQLKKTYKISKDMYENSTYNFEFKEATFLTNVKFPKGDPVVRDYEYAKLFKVVENKKYFFLYISRNQAFVVNKENISEEDLNTIRTDITNAKVTFVQRIKKSK